LSDPARFKSMQLNSRRMGHPNASTEIVEQLLSTQGRPQRAAPTVVVNHDTSSNVPSEQQL